MKPEAQSPLKRVLCVEDDPDTCDFLKFVMTSYEFHAVHTIGAAVTLISERPFDAYVLDNWLPDGSGIELCRYIRTTAASTPIIFTSAIGHRKDIDLAIEAGANRYLVKPYEPDALVQTVKELLNPTGDLVFKS
ncbi:MAG TPA: response regulator [Pyrinomonadaceae bacterium]|nr:response regulator [Pyrinomonadaceae bacterium]